MTTLVPKIDLKNGGSTPTGAINRTSSAKMQDIVSVKDFGAIGNGTTDDTTAIQAAFDNGGIVCFPSGTYKITARLSLDVKSTGIRGQGNVIIDASTVTTTGGNAEAIRVYSTATYNQQETLYNYQNTIENISFLGNRQTGIAGISVGRVGSTYAYSNDISVKNCGFYNFDLGVVFTENAWRTHFQTCGFWEMATSFVYFNSATNAGECMTFKDCAFVNGGEPSAGMTINNGQFHFHNCSFPGGGNTGLIDIYGSAHVVFDGWNFETQPQSTDHSLVQVRQSAKAVVQNSTILVNKATQSVPYFIVQDSGFLTVKDCTVSLFDSWTTTAAVGINTVITGGTNVILQNNTVYGTGASTPTTKWAVMSAAAGKVYDSGAELNTISEWAVNTTGTGVNTFTNTTANPKNGTRNYRAVAASTGSVSGTFSFNCGDVVGRTLIMGFWAQATAGTGTVGVPTINFFTKNDTLISTYAAVSITNVNAATYTWFGQSTTVPIGTSYISIALVANQVASGATVDYDDIIVNII